MKVFVAELRWVTVCFDVVLILWSILLVESTGIPFALFGDRIGTPMEVDAKFSISKPIGTIILLSDSIVASYFTSLLPETALQPTFERAISRAKGVLLGIHE